jgi:hypothetical protein
VTRARRSAPVTKSPPSEGQTWSNRMPALNVGSATVCADVPLFSAIRYSIFSR